MRYIVQIFTGDWRAPAYTAQKIIERLEHILNTVDVEKVILGWYPQASLYREIGAYLHKHHVDMLLWMPVFAELSDFTQMDKALDLRGNPLTGAIDSAGESFVFCCPTSPKNLQAVKDVYDAHFADGGFDGIFLDRVRTNSFVGGVSGVLSCGCDHCTQAYADHGVSLEEIASLYEAQGDRLFDAEMLLPSGEITFQNSELQRFFAAKGQVIANSITALCRHFKEKGLRVGFDLYAPIMSTFVGQHYETLAQEADFIKPMLYRTTRAPAGIGYEYELLKRCLPNAKGYPDIQTDAAFLATQATLSHLPCRVYPGIEINYLRDMAPTDPAYIKESIDVLEAVGVDGVTLSWNMMEAPDAHLQACIGCKR